MMVADVIFNEAHLSSEVYRNTSFKSFKVLQTQERHSYMNIRETETLLRITYVNKLIKTIQKY